MYVHTYVSASHTCAIIICTYLHVYLYVCNLLKYCTLNALLFEPANASVEESVYVCMYVLYEKGGCSASTSVRFGASCCSTSRQVQAL